MQRRNREISVFSLSAVDLFCSGMGAVMVMMVLLMPYFRKTSPPPAEAPVPALAAAAPSPPIPSPAPPAAKPGVLFHDLELMIVIDTTGSMGPQLEDLRKSLGNVVAVLSRLSETLRVGVVAYRDHGDIYLTRVFPLEEVKSEGAGIRRLGEFLRRLRADGGGDFPEAVAEALEQAVGPAVAWTPLASLPPASRQIILIVADAPGHDLGALRSARVVRSWRAGDERRKVSAACPSGVARYFAAVAEAGGGEVVGWADLLGAILDAVIERG